MSVFFSAAVPGDRFPALDLAMAGTLAGLTLLLKFNDGVTLCTMFYGLLAWRLFRFRRLVPVLLLV
jgi:hypothetical protein